MIKMNIENIKYPKTLHLPWSETVSKDDKILPDTSCFNGKDVIISQKMDGECTAMTKFSIHARSLSYKGLTEKQEWSRSWAKNLWSKIKNNIPENMKIFGENLFAKHSIYYPDLKSYFLVFNILKNDKFLNWEEVVDICFILGFETVPVIQHSIKWDADTVKDLWPKISTDKIEGYIVRNTDEFLYDNFSTNVAKFVRKDHVRSDKHWIYEEKIKNEIKN